MKKEDFLRDVMHEIEMLKKHATKAEKNRLNFDELRPYNAERCIYGQMTGDCRTKRAHKLMKLSCVRTFDLSDTDIEKGMHMKTVLKHLNGPFESQGWKGALSYNSRLTNREWKYLSALEGYIQLHLNNKKIIQYIKGEIDTLNLGG
jgi:hypothetical protein